MRSLFHFPLPCTTTLAVTVSYSNRPTAARNVPSPASCTHAPPAPLPSVAFRRPPAPPVPRLPRSGPRPTVTRSQGARHAAPPSLPRAAARSHRAPSPEYRPAAACTASPASRPPRAVARIASAPLRAAIRIPLCRHRADSALIAPPSRPSCAAAVLHVLRFAVRIAPTVRRHPRHPLALRRSRGPGWQEPHRMHPFSPNARKRPPSWQHPPEMHALRDRNGNILAPCIHFRAQSGDSGYMARESCRQGPSFASRNPKSRMARRCCQRRAAFPRQRPAVRRNGPCALRQRHAVRPNGLCALRRGPGLLAACAPLPSCLCPPRPAPPRHLARVHRRRLTRAALRRPRPATRSPYRCISPPAHRTHPASRADPPRPGNKRNSTNNSMRA